jgi:ribosomal protein L29
MAILKSKDIAKMNIKEIDEKLNELKIDLIKARVPTKKISKGVREIKRTIAKLLTIKKIIEMKNKKAETGGKK